MNNIEIDERLVNRAIELMNAGEEEPIVQAEHIQAVVNEMKDFNDVKNECLKVLADDIDDDFSDEEVNNVEALILMEYFTTYYDLQDIIESTMSTVYGITLDEVELLTTSLNVWDIIALEDKATLYVSLLVSEDRNIYVGGLIMLISQALRKLFSEKEPQAE